MLSAGTAHPPSVHLLCRAWVPHLPDNSNITIPATLLHAIAAEDDWLGTPLGAALVEHAVHLIPADSITDDGSLIQVRQQQIESTQ